MWTILRFFFCIQIGEKKCFLPVSKQEGKLEIFLIAEPLFDVMKK